MKTYIATFETEEAAIARCSLKNRACRAAGNLKDCFAVVDGPADDFCVVDLYTAIDLGQGYNIAD